MLKYLTHYTVMDCFSLLRGKNVYDVFDYKIDFFESENKASITFVKCNTHMCRSIHTNYILHFVPQADGTSIEMVFQNELYVLPIPCIPEKWVDEFMDVKFSAKRIEKEPSI